MADLADFLGKKKAEDPSGDEVGGSFMCQTCDQVVSTAFINYEHKKLIWLCDDDHRSEIPFNV